MSLTLPATGSAVTTDPVAGAHTQVVKLDLGAPGASDPVVGGLPVELVGTDVFDTSANANGTISLTLPAVAGKTNYVTGFEISGTGSTAGAAPYCQLIGLAALAAYYVIDVPAGVTRGVLVSVQFTRPIPALASDTAIQLVVPAFGAGNALMAASLHGFYR